MARDYKSPTPKFARILTFALLVFIRRVLGQTSASILYHLHPFCSHNFESTPAAFSLTLSNCFHIVIVHLPSPFQQVHSPFLPAFQHLHFNPTTIPSFILYTLFLLSFLRTIFWANFSWSKLLLLVLSNYILQSFCIIIIVIHSTGPVNFLSTLVSPTTSPYQNFHYHSDPICPQLDRNLSNTFRYVYPPTGNTAANFRIRASDI